MASKKGAKAPLLADDANEVRAGVPSNMNAAQEVSAED